MSFLRKIFGKAGTSTAGQPAAGATPDTRLLDDVVASNAAGRFGDSLARLDDALAASPADSEFLFARASTLLAWGRLHEARAAYAQIVAMGAARPGIRLQLGWLHLGAGAAAAAEASMREEIAADPASADAHAALAIVLRESGRLDAAVAACAAALGVAPDHFVARTCLGECRILQGDPVAAEAELRRAVAIDPKSARAWKTLGVALRPQDRQAEALAAFETAERLGRETGDDDGFFILAVQRYSMGEFDRGLDLLERNLRRVPSPPALRSYADLLLAAGRFAEGWNHYEARWLHAPLLGIRQPGAPTWTGQDLAGRTILLRVEQGFGDTIQFLRYAPHLKALGATVLLESFSDLAPDFAGVDRIVPRGASVEVDYVAYLLSLPRVFGTELDSIPAAVPYVQAGAAHIAKWKGRIASGPKLNVGLVWSGNPRHPVNRERSIALADLLPVLRLPGVAWHSLQKGPAAAQLAELPADVTVADLGAEFDDFSDTAAAIDCLDFVLTVDTSVAHLAGALGKPVWLLLAYVADWRWLMDRDDNPWYPTVRLFRQPAPGDWTTVVGRLTEALAALVETGSPPVPLPARTAPSPALVPRLVGGQRAGHRAGLSAATEARAGILQFLPDDAEVGTSLDWYGEYLQPQVDLLCRLVRPGAILLEAGAGIGAHALPLAAAAGPSGHVFLYEPDPLQRRILQQNLGANRIANATVMRRPLGAAADAEVDSIDALRLQHLQWLKTGANVAALDVLAGANETLWRLRPWLLMAARDDDAVAAEVAVAKSYSYRCWRMTTPLFDPRNFNRRGDDIFAGRAALAVIAFPEELRIDVALDGCVELS